MNKLISIVVVINDAQESDISIPISSINNQLGVEFSKLEIILVDNGRYRLEHPERLELFANLDLKYLQTDTVVQWADALQYGIDQATGTYVMVMGANGQLNQLNVLQNFVVQIEMTPNADVISGLVIDQEIDRNRKMSYQVGRDDRSMRGSLVRLDFLRNNNIRLEFQMGEYAEEFFCRVVNSLSQQTIRMDDIVYARFMSRNLDPAVLAPVADTINEVWVNMMTQWLNRLKEIDQQRFLDSFSRFIVQFYSKSQQADPRVRPEMIDILKNYVQQNKDGWDYAQSFIERLKFDDQNPKAPWNGDANNFEVYLQQIGN